MKALTVIAVVLASFVLTACSSNAGYDVTKSSAQKTVEDAKKKAKQ